MNTDGSRGVKLKEKNAGMLAGLAKQNQNFDGAP
jgi:hypothetical protein